jgi:hypothetical protein
MRIRYKHLGVAAVATLFAFAGPGGGAVAVPDSGAKGSSSADITLSDCLVESSKEISYVQYLAEDGSTTKDEDVDSETLDLTTVEGIGDVEEVEVKAGTTVETFGIACSTDDGDDEASRSGEQDETEDEQDGRRGPNVRSTADITLSGCLVESSKDISYVQYLAEDGSTTKDEDVDSETLDLTTVEGIGDVEEVEVKAGTTVETFGIACSTDDGDDEASGSGEQDGDTTDTDGDTDTGGDTDAGDETEAATITLNGCMVESSKDISNIEFFAGDTSWKDESINTQSFDLNTVDGIEDVETIEVKSSTTVESFSVSCGESEDGTTANSGSTEETEAEETETEETETEETETEETETEETETEETETEETETGTEEESDEDEDEDKDEDEDEDKDDDSEETEDA